MTTQATTQIKVDDLTPSIRCSGARCAILFDAEAVFDAYHEARVYEFGSIGSGTPEAAWHGRHLHLCNLNTEVADTSELEDHLREIAPQLLELGAELTVEWDGSNHRGRLSERGQEMLQAISLEIEQHLLERLPCFWDASDWFCAAYTGPWDATFAELTDEQKADFLRTGDLPWEDWEALAEAQLPDGHLDADACQAWAQGERESLLDDVARDCDGEDDFAETLEGHRVPVELWDAVRQAVEEDVPA